MIACDVKTIWAKAILETSQDEKGHEYEEDLNVLMDEIRFRENQYVLDKMLRCQLALFEKDNIYFKNYKLYWAKSQAFFIQFYLIFQ